MIRSLLSFTLLYLAAPAVWGGPFDPPPTDKTLEYLGILFGGQVGPIYLGGSANPLLSEMFKVFNFIVLSAGSLMVSYIAVISVLSTAQEGQILGRQWSSIWMPLRSILTLVLLVPTPGTGYAMIQISAMWIIVQGIGAADAVWNMVLDYLEAGISITGEINVPTAKLNEDSKNIVKQMLNAAVCMESIKTLSDATPFPVPSDWPYSQSEYVASDTAGGFRMWVVDKGLAGNSPPDQATAYGSVNFGNESDGTPFCGSFNIRATVKRNEWPEEMQASANLDSKAQEIYTAKILALTNMFGVLQPLAVRLVEETVSPRQNNRLRSDQQPSPAGYVSVTQDAYVNILKGMIKPNSMTDSSNYLSEVVNNGKINGWSAAGSYYFILNQGQEQALFNTVNFDPPTVGINSNLNANIPDFDSPTSQNNLTSYLNSDEQKFVLNRLKDSKSYFDNDILGTTDRLELGSVGSKSSRKLLAPLQAFLHDVSELHIKLMSESNKEPLLSIAQYGSNLMLGAEITWFITVGISAILSAVLGICSMSSPAFIIPLAFTTTIFSIVLLIMILLWTAGVTLMIYIPMLPYMLFIAGMISWFLLVIEALIATPLVALGLVSPTGDELGKVTVGLNLIATAFFKPAFMILSFILAARLFSAIVSFVNFGFSSAASSVKTQGSFLAPLAVIVLYTGFICALATKCFSLIYIIPDRVFRWIGGLTETTTTSALKEAKSELTKRASEIQTGLKAGSGVIDNASKKLG